MKRGKTLFLKVAVIVLGVPVLALCVFLIPKIGTFAGERYPEMWALNDLIMIDLYATAIPFYIALYQAFQLLNHIDAGEAFSVLSVHALKKIKYCALSISFLYVLGLPLLYLLAERDDAPGLIVIGLIMIFASMVIAVFAAVLQKLLDEAIGIKLENELTV